MISCYWSQKRLLTPGLYDNLICVQRLRVWKALCPIRSMQWISTCPWQRWSGSFRRRCGGEPAQRAQILQVEQAEINEHHKPHWFNTRWHRMNILRVQLFLGVFQLPKQTQKRRIEVLGQQQSWIVVKITFYVSEGLYFFFFWSGSLFGWQYVYYSYITVLVI